MTPLDRIICERIAIDGPIRVSDFMQICLLHPEHGYYVKNPAFGVQGDFITAPEISQMFGELLGLCLAQAWMDQGAPADFHLLELGPGSGTLMSDILRATRSVPGLHRAADITLLEASETMQKRQQHTLSDYQVNWISSLDELAEKPIFVVANEFLDALPIQQYVRVGDVWHERLIGAQDNQLGFGLSPVAQTGDYLQTRLGDTQDGDIVEVSEATQSTIGLLSKHIQAHGGCAKPAGVARPPVKRGPKFKGGRKPRSQASKDQQAQAAKDRRLEAKRVANRLRRKARLRKRKSRQNKNSA